MFIPAKDRASSIMYLNVVLVWQTERGHPDSIFRHRNSPKQLQTLQNVLKASTRSPVLARNTQDVSLILFLVIELQSVWEQRDVVYSVDLFYSLHNFKNYFPFKNRSTFHVLHLVQDTDVNWLLFLHTVQNIGYICRRVKAVIIIYTFILVVCLGS